MGASLHAASSARLSTILLCLPFPFLQAAVVKTIAFSIEGLDFQGDGEVRHRVLDRLDIYIAASG